MVHSNVRACSDTAKNVLCVDDNEAVLGSLRLLLGYFGYRVNAFTCSAEAMLALSDSDCPVDLLIVDQNMPGEKGIELARKAKLVRPDLPIILTTGFVDDRLRSEARDAHIDVLLEKPLVLPEFRKTIESILQVSATSH